MSDLSRRILIIMASLMLTACASPTLVIIASPTPTVTPTPTLTAANAPISTATPTATSNSDELAPNLAVQLSPTSDHDFGHVSTANCMKPNTILLAVYEGSSNTSIYQLCGDELILVDTLSSLGSICGLDLSQVKRLIYSYCSLVSTQYLYIEGIDPQYTTYLEVTTGVYSPQWVLDNHILSVKHDHSALVLLDAENQTTMDVVEGNLLPMIRVAPDGRTIAYVAGFGDPIREHGVMVGSLNCPAASTCHLSNPYRVSNIQDFSDWAEYGTSLLSMVYQPQSGAQIAFRITDLEGVIQREIDVPMTTPQLYGITQAFWTPNRIIFLGVTSEGSNVWALNLDDHSVVQLTDFRLNVYFLDVTATYPP
jgi:hypothetical protein